MITTGAVDDDLIEQFKNDIQQYDSVTSATRKHGRSVDVRVQKTDDGVPKPQRDLGDVEDGVIKCDDYVISGLAGSGHAPGDKYTHCLAISPYCSECGDQPQKGLDDDDTRCKDCAFGDNLLSADPGETVTVEAGEDVWGVRHDEGEQFEATADEDGFLRDHDENEVMNNGRYSIVEDDSDGDDYDDRDAFIDYMDDNFAPGSYRPGEGSKKGHALTLAFDGMGFNFDHVRDDWDVTVRDFYVGTDGIVYVDLTVDGRVEGGDN